MFESLQVRNYRLFATGQLISLIFRWVQITAQDWLVLQLSHSSPTALGLVTALQFTPVLLLSLYAGKLADRFDKRLLLIMVNIAWLVLAGLMGVLVVSGAVVLWQVYVFAALWGTTNALETPVRQAFASELVGRELLPNALALSSATFNSARIVGPAVGGIAIALLGVGTAFVVNAVAFIAPLIALLLMRPAELYREGIGRKVAASDARVIDGLRYVLRRRDLLLPLGLMLIIGMVGFNFQITLAVLAKNVFHTGAASFGLLTSALAAGALVGALAGSSRRERPSVWSVIWAAIAFGVLETVCGLMPTYLTTAIVLVPSGYAMIYLAQAANQRIQLGVAPEFRGRVMALYILVFLGTNPIGAPILGWFAETAGTRESIWVGGLISLASGLIALAVRGRMARRVAVQQESKESVEAPAASARREFHPVSLAATRRAGARAAKLNLTDGVTTSGNR
jgi:MFS family permease